MARYNWDLLTIRNNIDKLTQMLNNNISDDEKITIQETILQYQLMLSTIAGREKIEDDCKLDIPFNTLFNNFMEYLSMKDEKFINLILDTFKLIKDFEPNFSIDYIVPFTNDKLLEICDNFMETTLPATYFKKYRKEILAHPKHIHIRNYFDYANGVTFIDPVLKQKYILINRRNQLHDLYVPAHEYFHFLFNDYDCHFYSNNDMYYSQEIEGSLANIMFADYYRNYSNNKDSYDIAKQMDESFLFQYQTRTISLVFLTDYLEATNENGKFRANKFNKYLNYFDFKTPIDKEELYNYLGDETADNVIEYNISFLAALDLFYIYKRDPEFAFYLLENIRFIKNDTDLLRVFRRNHITFMDDNFENLKKYIKKIERL